MARLPFLLSGDECDALDTMAGRSGWLLYGAADKQRLTFNIRPNRAPQWRLSPPRAYIIRSFVGNADAACDAVGA